MRKDFDEMYRLGLYGNGIERIKLKKAVQIIQKASASQVKIVDIGHDNFDSACEALELGSVDMAVVDMAQLIRMEKNDENLPYGVVISGVLKRGDSRYVMIRKRHAKDLIENAVVASECDAVFVLLEDIKAARLHNSFLYRYTIMDYGECVPVHGEGVYAMLTKGKKEAVRTARELSHKSTAECFEIEDDIISRVMQNVYVKTCDVYARISSDRLEIYADVTGNRGRIRVNERGTFVNKNLIITKIVDRISKSM